VTTRCARLAGLVLLLALGPAGAATLRVETLAEGLEHPWSLAFLPDGAMLVTERAGRLRYIDPQGDLASEPITGLPEDIHVQAQAGLKEIALAPDFADTGRVYLTHACGSRQANALCLTRARFAEHALHDRETIFRTRPERQGSAHYGGRIAFLPDGTLLLTHGDGFVYREQAQRPENHLGSLLRLNPDGTAPADNPAIADAAPETWSYGHRNIQGIVHDPATDTVWVAEHGPRGGDELNRVRPGGNYGWPLATHGVDYTGARITPHTSLPGMADPLWTWTPALAPGGMTRYSGDLFPHWEGDLLIAGLAGKSVRRMVVDANGVDEAEILFRDRGERLRDIRTGPGGALYLLTDYADGRLLRVTPAD